MTNHTAPSAANNGFLRDLQLFCTVARRANFITASNEMGISPSHVSKRIAMLEQSLGVKLFVHTTRCVTITDDGEAAFRWAQKILDDVQGMADSFGGAASEPRGLIRISTSLRLGREHVSPILSLLRKRYGDLDIYLELLDRRVDLLGESFDIEARCRSRISSRTRSSIACGFCARRQPISNALVCRVAWANSRRMVCRFAIGIAVSACGVSTVRTARNP